jgi:replicative DNA helicase
MRRIKNLDKVKDLIKAKLPDYLKELGLRVEGSKVQCPHTEVHEHGDKEKLSAAFLPQSQNKLIYCFVEDKVFDIFDIYSLKTGKNITGAAFYEAVKVLAEKYGVPIEEEYEFSMQEQERRRKRKVLEQLHVLSTQHAKDGVALYKKRNINKEKLLHWKIGYLTPDLISRELDKDFKMMYEYRLLAVFTHPALVIPVFDEDQQYVGLIMRQFGAPKGNEYLNISMQGKNLFNIHNVRGSELLTVVEGAFDTMALYPEKNVVGCLTNSLHDADLEKVANLKPKKIRLALDPDNLFQGTARDGFLKAILKMKNLDSEIEVVVIPSEGDKKPDPDEYMKTHTLEEFNKLPKMSAITYLLKNFEKNVIKADRIYEFIAGCPNLIRREQFITECANVLKIGKRQLAKSIESISENKESFNMIQYVQEKDAFEELLESFTESAWNKNFQGIPSGFPLFDRKFGGFEDTLYLFVGYPEMGKCWGRGTPILTYSGDIKPVEQIKAGDLLMGENCYPVQVESTCRGREEMYRVIPHKGDSWSCNKSHILVLFYRNGGKDQIIEITVEDFLKRSPAFQERCKLIKKQVDFTHDYPIPFDTYFIGLWLGDGTRGLPHITQNESELEPYFQEFAKDNQLIYKKVTSKTRCPKHTFTNNWQGNPLLTELKTLVINNEKRITERYLKNTRDNRLRLLAGLIDSDGYLTSGGYEVCTKWASFAEDIVYLARSLGFQANISKKIVNNITYYRIRLDGLCHLIPCKLKRKIASKRQSKKDVNHTGFRLEALGVGDYYGFTLNIESNGRCLLGDFTLTHNTTFLLNFVYRLAQCRDTFVAFYSLDDGAKRAVLPRLLSIASGLTSKQIKQPSKDIEAKWFAGMKKIEALKENLIIKDGSEVRTIKDMENFVKIHAAMAEEKGKKFFIVIDNLHDIVASHKFESVQNSQRVASFLKRLPQEINCPIIATAEVPKSADAKPSGKDIKESIDLWYAARFVAGIFSNFHLAKNKNQTNLVWQDENGRHQPIMELFVSKNQTGEAEHGSLFYKFSMVTNNLIECTEKETQLLSAGQFINYLSD